MFATSAASYNSEATRILAEYERRMKDFDGVLTSDFLLNKLGYGAENKSTTMTRLNLSSHEIESIAPGVFVHFPALEELYLNGNRLTAVKVDTFRGLSKLRTLWLGRNQIRSLEQGAFAHLPALATLKLDTNKLESLEPGVFGTSLVSLSVEQNQLSSLHKDTFRSLNDTLQVLIADCNKFSGDWHAEMNPFNNLKELKELYLTHNQLTSIDFEGLGSLEQLWLDNNHLTKLNFSFTKLRILRVEANKLSGALPENALRQLPALQLLSLSQNQLEWLEPGALNGACKTLETLYLDGNRLSFLDEDTFTTEENAFPRMNKLNLSSNEIATLGANTFKIMPNLQILQLHTNQLTVLDASALAYNANLKTLDLSSNCLTDEQLEGGKKLEALRQLRELNLNMNQLSNVVSGLFAQLEKLEKLDLRRNKIEECASDAFKKLVNLKLLRLDGNPLSKEQKQEIDLSTLKQLQNSGKVFGR